MQKNYLLTSVLLVTITLLYSCSQSKAKRSADSTPTIDKIDSESLKRTPEFYIGKWKKQGEDYPPKAGHKSACLTIYKDKGNITVLQIYTQKAADGGNFGVKGQYWDDTTRFDNAFKVKPALPHPPFDVSENEIGNIILLNEYGNRFRRFRCVGSANPDKLYEDNINGWDGNQRYSITWERIKADNNEHMQSASNTGNSNILMVSVAKAYLYDKPDANSKTQSCLVTGESVEVLKSDGDFVYTGRTGNGSLTHVWMKRADLTTPDKFSSE